MKNLNICIDIDGTITDAYYWLDMCNEHFGKKLSKDDVTDYCIPKVLGVSEEEYNRFYHRIKFKMHSEQELRPGSKVFIQKLSRIHNIYFVTARDKSLRMLTRGYLVKNKIPFDELHVLGSHYKVNAARSLKCDIFIEDNYDNAIQLSEAGFKVLLMDTNYNRGNLNVNIKRVYHWSEVYKEINKLLLQAKAM